MRPEQAARYARIAALAEAGHTAAEIQRITGHAQDTIRLACRHHGIDPARWRHGRTQDMRDADRADVIDLHAAGETPRRIAERTGISKTRINVILISAGHRQRHHRRKDTPE